MQNATVASAPAAKIVPSAMPIVSPVLELGGSSGSPIPLNASVMFTSVTFVPFRNHSAGMGGVLGGGGALVGQLSASRGHDDDTRMNAASVAPFSSNTFRFCTAHASRSSSLVS